MLKSTSKQGLGALIWLRRTRPDVGFAVAQIATQIAEAYETVEKAKNVVNLYIKIVCFVKNRKRK